MKIRFLFDYLSPYSYLAWTQVHTVAARHGALVEPVPVLFAALLDANGQKGPAEIPGKREYTFKDVLRKAALLGVPVAPPASHPFNPLLPLRASSLDEIDPEDRRRLIDGLYRATWVESRAVDQPDVVEDVAREAGLDGPQIVRAARAEETKTRLRAQTEEAIARGVWGVPTLLATHPQKPEELFWGLDSLPHLEAFLRGEDPVPTDATERWATVRPSATRRI